MKKWIIALAVLLVPLSLIRCQAMPDGSYEVNVNVHLPDGGIFTIGGPVVVSNDGGTIVFTRGTGGAATGGQAGAGGASEGGSAGSAGASSGGSSTGGVPTGGAGGAGGAATGGSSTGGASTGGAAGSAGASNACGGPFSGKHAAAMARIGASKPAYATADFTYPNTAPSDANDSSAPSRWRSWDPGDPANPDHRFEYVSATKPVWLAYDLSSVTEAARQSVLVFWNNGTPEYDTKIFGRGGGQYNGLKDYALESNAAAGGSVPAAGWAADLSITGNTYHSRQHLLDMHGDSWIRLFITKINGSDYNWDANVNFDVYDASSGCGDSWLMLGDSITTEVQRLSTEDTVASLVSTATSGAYSPAIENGGIGGISAHDTLVSDAGYGPDPVIDYWLAQFPGKYVCLSYGTNGLGTSQSQIDGVFSDIEQLVAKIYTAGKIPCISYVPWAQDATLQYAAPILNSMLDGLFSEDPQIVRGPQFYTLMQGHTEWYQDSLHPNATGAAVMRQAWADALLTEVYN